MTLGLPTENAFTLLNVVIRKKKNISKIEVYNEQCPSNALARYGSVKMFSLFRYHNYKSRWSCGE